MLNKELLHQICIGLRLGLQHKTIAERVGCNVRTVRKLSFTGRKRVLLWGDSHCGSNVGLTPPAYQTKYTPNPRTEEHRTQNKWANLQKESWKWYCEKLKLLKPIDNLFYLGDGIDGTGYRAGGTDLIQIDRKVDRKSVV